MKDHERVKQLVMLRGGPYSGEEIEVDPIQQHVEIVPLHEGEYEVLTVIGYVPPLAGGYYKRCGYMPGVFTYVPRNL